MSGGTASRRLKSRSEPRASGARAESAAPDARTPGGLARYRHLLAALAGLAVLASFAPLHVVPAGWAGLGILFGLWATGSPKQAAWTTVTFALVFFGVGLSWILDGLIRSAVMPVPAAVASVAFLVLGSSAQLVAGSFIVSSWVKAPLWARLALIAPAVWTLVELVRGVTLWGLPWLHAGYGQLGGPLAGLAPWVGSTGVSLAAGIAGGLLALAILERGRAWRLWLPAVAGVLGVGLLAGTVHWTEPAGPPLEVVVVQPNIPAEKRFEPSELQPALDLFASMTLRELDRKRADLVVWPEIAIPARSDQVEPFLEGLTREMRRRGTTVLTGVIERDRVGDASVYFNAAIATTEPRQRYLKRRLLPFTEYMPGFLPEAYRRARFEDATGIFSPGPADQPPIAIGAVRLGITICWESAYASSVHGAGAQLLGALTNEDWFRDTLMRGYALDVARMRSREAGLDFVRAANSGISAIIHAGDVAAASPVSVRTTLRGSVQPRRGTTPYARLGDAAPWLALGTCLFAAAVAGRLARGRRGIRATERPART